MSLFFIHGGPGFNSQADRLILSEPLTTQGIATTFWDEPSSLRPQGPTFSLNKAYENWLSELHKALSNAAPRLVVASSFGAKGLIDSLRLYPDTKINQVVMVGPTLNMGAVFKRMMEISEKDLQASAPEISRRLRECREGSGYFWDAQMQEGLGLVWQNPNLLVHYFTNMDVLSFWAGVGANPEYAIDMQSQMAVLNDMAKLQLPKSVPQDCPVLVLTGASDPVFIKDEVAAEIKSAFTHVQFEQWNGCGHMPQLEKPKEFVELIKRLLT